MTRRRSRLQIAVEVLRTTDGGRSEPSGIMYKSSLSRRPMTRILDRPINDGLVRIDRIKRGRHFHSGRSVKGKGRGVFEAYQNLGALFELEFPCRTGVEGA